MCNTEIYILLSIVGRRLSVFKGTYYERDRRTSGYTDTYVFAKIDLCNRYITLFILYFYKIGIKLCL